MARLGRPWGSGSVLLTGGGVRSYLHVKPLRALAAQHPDHAPMLLAAVEAIQTLSANNRKLGRQVGSMYAKRVLSGHGASLKRNDPETPAVIADLAGDAPVTVYVGRDRKRVRVTTRADRMPRAAKVIGRYDHGCDYRAIAADLREAACAS